MSKLKELISKVIWKHAGNSKEDPIGSALKPVKPKDPVPPVNPIPVPPPIKPKEEEK